jgi:hypothetical protein
MLTLQLPRSSVDALLTVRVVRDDSVMTVAGNNGSNWEGKKLSSESKSRHGNAMKWPNAQHDSDSAWWNCLACGQGYEWEALEKRQLLEYLLVWLDE